MPETPPEWALEMMREARVGHLSTSSADAEPHVVPVCFVLHGERLYSVIDEKPKTGRRLLRLRNVEATGRAALVVDRYDEDWTRLAWVLVRGAAEIINPPAAEHGAAIRVLREKYVQYREMALEDAEVVVLTPERWTVWRASDGNAKPT